MPHSLSCVAISTGHDETHATFAMRPSSVTWNDAQVCAAFIWLSYSMPSGYGGGYMDREDVEYIDREDDEEFDEFGRKKKKQRMDGDDSTSAPERRVQVNLK
jgi:hypothetical protein